jgi:hypothetical protein
MKTLDSRVKQRSCHYSVPRDAISALRCCGYKVTSGTKSPRFHGSQSGGSAKLRIGVPRSINRLSPSTNGQYQPLRLNGPPTCGRCPCFPGTPKQEGTGNPAQTNWNRPFSAYLGRQAHLTRLGGVTPSLSQQPTPAPKSHIPTEAVMKTYIAFRAPKTMLTHSLTVDNISAYRHDVA